MSNPAPIRYLKMNGLGNEVLIVDMRASTAKVTAGQARAAAGHPRTTFDQMMVLYKARTPGTDALIQIYNTDGSIAEACGNGTRCVADLLCRETGRDDLALETVAGLLTAKRTSDGLFSVDMGVPRFGWQDIPLVEAFYDTRTIELQIGPIDNPLLHTPSAVNVGNPHCIFWVDDVHRFDLGRFGPMLEHHRLFPEGANISLAQVTSSSSLTLRVWERGAGLTKACGTAACAAAVAAHRKRLTGRDVTVTLPGGDLHISWRADDHIVMTGPSTFEYEGHLDPQTFTVLAA
jgi:diaminopimelate epimerase